MPLQTAHGWTGSIIRESQTHDGRESRADRPISTEVSDKDGACDNIPAPSKCIKHCIWCSIKLIIATMKDGLEMLSK